MAKIMSRLRAALGKLAPHAGSADEREDRPTAPKPPGIVELRHPTQCILWEQPARVQVSDSGFFEKIECYENSSHLARSLYKCRECGQLYFYEWYEWVDWDQGNDKCYITLIPVQTPAEIEALKQTSTMTLMGYFPRLQWDGNKIWWNGK